MAADTTILSGDVGVWWLSNNRSKMRTWEGTTGTHTMNDLYSAMQTLQDESDTIDDGTCFNADTPTEYTCGIIDQGDNDPWYVSFEVMEHITGGSLKTNGWAHVDSSNTGVVIVPGTNSGTPITTSDYGYTVTGATTGSGTLLELIEGSHGDFLVIRPDSDTGDEFATTSQIITSARGAFTFTQSASETENTGDMVWANIYSIGTVDDYVHMYVYQGEFDASTPASPATDSSIRVYSINSSTADYWGEGHIDICVPINRWWRDQSAGVWDTVDDGYLRVFARKGGDLYSSFEVANSTTSGGRNPVPLQTSTDLNQGTGTKTITTGSWGGDTFLDGEVILQTTSNARGIIDLTNSVTDTSISYFPIAESGAGGVITAMDNTNVVTGQTSGDTATSSGSPADAGPATTSWFTNSAFPDIKFGYTAVSAVTNKDIDNDGTDEHWGIVVDCNDNTLAETYEWLKYICQYTQGETDPVEQAFEDDLSQSDIYGEEFIGGTAYFGYSAISGTIEEGNALTQATTLATGLIITHDTTNDVVLLRNTRGSFNGSNQIDEDQAGGAYFTPDEAGNFAASVSSPFGTFAGGTFFGARGVILENWLSANENQFILTDIEGSTRERPTSVLIEVTNLHGNAVTETDADLCAVYPLTGSGGDIDKDLLTCDGGETVGGTSIATSAIPVWPPSSGRLLFTDVSANAEYVISYASWSSATDAFTLDSLTPAGLTTGTDSTTLVSTTNELDTLSRGDLVVNDTRGAHSYVTDVQAGSNTVNISPAIASQASTDTVHINAVPDLDGTGTAIAATDTVLPLIIHTYPTASSAQASVIYPGSTMYFRVKVRNSRETDLTNGPIKPFSSDGSTSGTDQTIQVTRTIDTIIS